MMEVSTVPVKKEVQADHDSGDFPMVLGTLKDFIRYHTVLSYLLLSTHEKLAETL